MTLNPFDFGNVEVSGSKFSVEIYKYFDFGHGKTHI